ncbi:MAG: Stage V sporulation protein K [Thermoanaerobacterales bacterium 50_218]|nr:MAG: Stage V sporulation protein K [Thermoanaerobacterales bacterium 50_218]HAA89925.1 stage V sporulation protein K [Peptococcaceae bacterium]
MNLRFQLGKESIGSPKVARNVQAQDRAEDVLQELNSLIGLTEVKKLIAEIYAYVEIQKRRKKENLQADPLVLHMIFKGNPGTGKTTVARIIGKLFRAMGVLSRGHLIEVERADLVGEYIGHTAQKTREQIRQALGGVLFIDEAYSLARGGEKDFGKESIDVLVKAMEDHKDDFILILAGYKEEMEWFLKSNPGLRSRFPIHIDFPDYTITELYLIGEMMLRNRQYKLAPEAQKKLYQILEGRGKSFQQSEGNARLVRNIIEQAIRRQAVRLVRKSRVTREELMLIKAEDLE